MRLKYFFRNDFVVIVLELLFGLHELVLRKRQVLSRFIYQFQFEIIDLDIAILLFGIQDVGDPFHHGGFVVCVIDLVFFAGDDFEVELAFFLEQSWAVGLNGKILFEIE